MSRRDEIITSSTAEQMLRSVAPIYDESYVGLWLFEAIGREYDDLWEIVNTLADQMRPETATWSIELWERRYNLDIPSAGTLEERRNNVLVKRYMRLPMNPARLEYLVEKITGSPSHVRENAAPYTFELYFSTRSKQAERKIQALVQRCKPSHQSFTLVNARQHEGLSYIGAYTIRAKRLKFGEVR